MPKYTEYPRTWKEVEADLTFLCEAYVSGIYMAVVKDKETIEQRCIEYRHLSTLIKKLKLREAEGKVTDLCMSPIPEDVLKYIN